MPAVPGPAGGYPSEEDAIMKRKMIQKAAGREEGFLSAFFLIFLVTLALLGLGAYSLMRSESANTVNQMKLIQADASLNAGAFFSLNALSRSLFDSQTEAATLSIGGADVTVDTSYDAATNIIALTVTSTIGSAERKARIEFQLGIGMRDKAIITTGIDNGVSARNENNVVDDRKLVDEADSIPTIRLAMLKAMATAQGHKIVGDCNGSGINPGFYQPDGVTPNIWYITGNLTISGSKKASGIFVVDGDVTINGADRITGILYLPNITSTVINGGGNPTESSIRGALISHGDITGHGSHTNVRWVKEYMYLFCDWFQTYPDVLRNNLVRWIYT
jgi:hypothetical protein